MGFLHDLYSARGKVITAPRSAYIVGDKAPYTSPMDRQVVDGRSAHRDHMKRHGVVEAGDMKLGESQSRIELGGVREDVQRAIQEHNR